MIIKYQFPYMGTKNKYTASIVTADFSRFKKIIFRVLFAKDDVSMSAQLVYSGNLVYTGS
jgi:hypothetical protein